MTHKEPNVIPSAFWDRSSSTDRTVLPWQEHYFPTPWTNRRDGATLALTENLHLVVGGQAPQGQALRSVEAVEWGVRRSWRFPSLTKSRIGCGVAKLGDRVFCLGGLSMTTGDDEDSSPPLVLASVEGLTYAPPNISSWQEEQSSLTTPRWAPAVVTLQDKYIFCLGGRNAAWEEVSTAEVGMLRSEEADGDGGPSALVWSKLPYAMQEKRFAAAAVAISNKAFIILGGYNGKSWSTSVCMYEFDEEGDAKDGSWQGLPAMPVAVIFGRAVYCPSLPQATGSFIFVAGGSPTGTTGSLQVYSVDRQVWTVIDDVSPLDGAALWLSADALVSWGGPLNKLQSLDLPTACQTGRLAVACLTSRGEKSDSALVVVSHAVALPFTPPAEAAPATTPVLPEGCRMVHNREYFVEGEMARYTGPVNSTGQRHGKGLLVWADHSGRFYPKELSQNTYYDGAFAADSRTGDGVMFFLAEDRIYRGQFVRGVLSGPGSLFDGAQGMEYNGEFKKGTAHGEGRAQYSATKQTWMGMWKSGKPVTGELRDAGGHILRSGTGPWPADLNID
jgi:hypothetical protein